MPTVPVVEQTANGAPQYDAPQVAPMRNFAPGQIEALGQSVEQAGTTAMTIGQRMQDQVDEAAVKNAEYNSLSQAQQINSDPQTGFLNQKGQAAVDQYQAAQQGVVKAFKDQLDGLTSHQQKMFQPLMQAHLLSLGQQMSTHDFQQKSQMAADASSARSNLFANKAGQSASSYLQNDGKGNRTGDFWTSTGTAEQEMLNFVRITRGASAGSDIANQALQSVHTQIGANAIAQMMNAKASHAAVQAMYDDMKSKDWFDARTQNALDQMVKNYSEQETTRAAIEEQLSTAMRAKDGKPTTATGTPDYQVGIQGAMPTTTAYDPKSGSITINVAKGTSLKAPADGKVIQAGDDANNGNFSVQMQHADGSVTTVTGLSSANVKVGDEVQRGEDVATSGTPAGSSAPSVVWSLKDKDGNAVDPTKAGLPAVDLHTIIDEKVLDTAVDGLRKQITDPQLQEQAVNQMVGIVRGNQQMAAARAAQLYRDASDIFLTNGFQWQKIPTDLFNKLKLTEQEGFKQAQNAHTIQLWQQTQFLQQANEVNVVRYFQQHPDKLTPDAVDQAGSQLSIPAYNLLKAQSHALQSHPQGVIDAQALNAHIAYFAGHAGVNLNPQTDADMHILNQLTTRVQQDIQRIQSQNSGKITDQQIDNAIQQDLIQRAFAAPRDTASSQQAQSASMPSGATHIVPGSDGQMHYTDGTNDLGIVGAFPTPIAGAQQSSGDDAAVMRVIRASAENPLPNFPVPSKTQQNIANQASHLNGNTAYLYGQGNGSYPANTNKCNEFVADTISASGIPRPQVPKSGILGRLGVTRDPTAKEWATMPIPGWSAPDSVANARPGDVIAVGHHDDHEGHVGVVVAPGQTASANALTNPPGIITINNWGFRPSGQNEEHSGDRVVVRHYIGVNP